MTAQDIIGNFKHERERFRLMRSDPKISSVSIRAISPESAEMNQVDPKRWVITDEQLLEAMTRATPEDAAKRLH